MSHTVLPFNIPFMTGKEKSYIQQALSHGPLSAGGIFSQRAETELTTLTGCIQALLTNSCTAALSTASLILDIGTDDEIILPSYTFPSSANAFVACGAKIIFADIDPETLSITAETIAPLITAKTKAILVVHYGGETIDMHPIISLAKAHGLYVIEDAAQSVMSNHGGKHAGTFGHLGAISFHASKNIQCGEGGALLINDPSLLNKAQHCRDKGTNRVDYLAEKVSTYSWTAKSSSAPPNELTAAFLTAQLEEKASITQQRKEAHLYYYQNIASNKHRIPGLCSFSTPTTGSNGHIFYIIFNSPADMHRTQTKLLSKGIQASTHYMPLHQSPMGSKITPATLPITEKTSNALLRLPLFTSISRAQQDRVLQALIEK